LLYTHIVPLHCVCAWCLCASNASFMLGHEPLIVALSRRLGIKVLHFLL
jgi:hypothetical protein